MGGGTTVNLFKKKKQVGCVFCQKFPGEKEMLVCCDATASSFVNKVRGEVFTYFDAVTVKCHSGMRNGLFGLPE
jgi:hypothetical protein